MMTTKKRRIFYTISPLAKAITLLLGLAAAIVSIIVAAVQLHKITEEEAYIYSIISCGIIVVFGLFYAVWAAGQERKIKDEEEYQQNKNKEFFFTVLIEKIILIKGSPEIDFIVEKHKRKITEYIESLSSKMRDQIKNVVTVETLHQFEKAGQNKQRQFDIIMSLMEQISSFEATAKFISKIHSDCLDEIELYLVDWLRENETLKYYNAQNPVSGDRKLFSLDEVESIISEIKSRLKSITLQELFFGRNTAQDVTVSAALVSLGLAGEILEESGSDMIHDHVINSELGEEVLHQVFEYVGASLFMLGPVLVCVRLIRFLYKHRDRTDDVELLKREIIGQIESILHDLKDKALVRVNEDSNSYLNRLLKNFEKAFNQAQSNTIRFGRYI